MEARGKQEHWQQTRPEVLSVLRETAIIQSSESSNRIEGVEVEAERLVPLLAGRSKPRDRSEEELFGYKKALELIYKDYNRLEISPETIKKLHKISQGNSSGDAGEWKKKNNEIVEILPSGERKVRFVPLAPEITPGAIAELCGSYENHREQSVLPDIAAIAMFTLDFLCVHPFRDGNGRVSRLLSLLLLLQAGYEIGKYISLERLVEAFKERYYETLKMSSIGWHDATHDLIPFLNFFTTVIREGYRELEEQVKLSEHHSGTLSSIIERQVLSRMGEFSLSDLKKTLPTTSEQLIKKVLSALKANKKIGLEGKGRKAKWRVL